MTYARHHVKLDSLVTLTITCVKHVRRDVFLVSLIKVTVMNVLSMYLRIIICQWTRTRVFRYVLMAHMEILWSLSAFNAYISRMKALVCWNVPTIRSWMPQTTGPYARTVQLSLAHVKLPIVLKSQRNSLTKASPWSIKSPSLQVSLTPLRLKI